MVSRSERIWVNCSSELNWASCVTYWVGSAVGSMGSWFWTWATRSLRNVCSWASGSVEVPEVPDEVDELDASDPATLGEGMAALAGVIIIRSAPGLSGAAGESLQP